MASPWTKDRKTQASADCCWNSQDGIAPGNAQPDGLLGIEHTAGGHGENASSGPAAAKIRYDVADGMQACAISSNSDRDRGRLARERVQAWG